MQQPINYTGYTANNSDLTCQDGELDLAVNLINEDGAMRPIMPPTKNITLGQNEAVVFIHSTPTGKNYILSRLQSDGTLQLLTMPVSTAVQSTQTAQSIGSVPDVISADAVGNIIMLVTSAGLRYLPWRDGAYSLLDARPPFVNIDFGLKKIGTLEDSGVISWPPTVPLGDVGISWRPGQPDTFDDSAQFTTDGRQGIPGSGPIAPDELSKITEAVYSVLNPAVAEEVTKKGRFYQPFFIRYAYRMYDGSYFCASAPILMLPTHLPPIVKLAKGGSNEAAQYKLQIPFFELRHRILPDNLETLANWEGLIVGIDVFISPPVYTYDQSAQLLSHGVQCRKYWLLSHYDWDPFKAVSHTGGTSELLSKTVFTGHYCEQFEDVYTDKFQSVPEAGRASYIAAIGRHPKFNDNLINSHTFYKFAEISFANFKSGDELKKLAPVDESMTNLTSRESLPDEFRSGCDMFAKSVYAYNSRFNVAGISLKPAMPFSLRSSVQYTQTGGSLPEVKAILKVWTVINNVKCLTVRDLNTGMAELVDGGIASLPRYVFYPDSTACKMQIEFANSNTVYTLNLTPHPELNGAYYYQGLLEADCTASKDISVSAVRTGDNNDDATELPVKLFSKLYTSDINNPFIFPVAGINTVGSGEILRVASAAKALSQGQFGQFPLYAFTTEGVWALSVNDTGSYSARQPITRDVCNNPDGILQIDSAVLFTSDRGIMLLTGSQTECISDSLNGPLAVLARKLPYIDRLFRRIGVQAFSYFAPAGFDRFLTGCGMMYDYTHQRILVFNPDYLCAFAFSLKSRQWGMFLSDIKAGINSYPEALALDSAGNVCNFSVADTTAKVGTLLLTRPLKLGSPYVMKTVRGMQQWGKLGHYDAGCMLYGSRDLEHWRHIANSATVQLHGISGSPYNYFSVLVLANLQSHQSLSAATLDIHPHPYRHNLGNQ